MKPYIPTNPAKANEPMSCVCSLGGNSAKPNAFSLITKLAKRINRKINAFPFVLNHHFLTLLHKDG